MFINCHYIAEVSITKEVDDVTNEIIKHFKDGNSTSVIKVHQMCRMLYHLREGPLLNGPCVVSICTINFLTLARSLVDLRLVIECPRIIYFKINVYILFPRPLQYSGARLSSASQCLISAFRSD